MKNIKHKENIQKMYSLTNMQKGMLFYTLNGDKNNNLYLHQIKFDVEGFISIEKLNESLNYIINKYDVFRTLIMSEKLKQPMQIVLKEVPSDINIIDMHDEEKETLPNLIKDFMIKDRQRGFELSDEIAIRITLIKKSEEEYTLVCCCHHILIDGWSFGIIMNELLNVYGLLCEGKPVNPEKTFQFDRYVNWQEMQDTSQAKNWWSNSLKLKNEQYTKLLNEESGQVYQKKTYQSISFNIDGTLYSKVKEYVKNNKVTQSVLYMTVWGNILKGYNQSEEVVFGYVTSGRNIALQGIESMVGLFVNTLPVKLLLDNNSFDEQVQQVMDVFQMTEAHSNLSLYDILKVSEHKPDLFNSIIVVENLPITEMLNSNDNRNLDFTLKNCEVNEQTNYDLTLKFEPTNELKVTLLYCEQILSRQTIETIYNHFVKVLSYVVENGHEKFSNHLLVSDYEKNNLIYNFNKTSTDYPKDNAIIDIFDRVANEYGHNYAIEFESKRLTYDELNSKVKQVTKYLIDQGIECGDVVGVISQNSIEMIVAILGILGSGASYLPISPKSDFPIERALYMLEDTKAKIVLTYQCSSNLIKECTNNGIEVVEIDRIIEKTENITDFNYSRFDENNIAYIIYTSGSTGNPKGVLVSNKSVLRIAKNTNYISINSNDRVIQLSSYTFDGSVFDIFSALLNGATLVITPQYVIDDITNLPEFIEKNKVSVGFFTTALFNVLVESYASHLKGMRKILFGGERSSVVHVNKAFEVLGENKIIHVYGPTESTVFSTYYPINGYCKMKQVPIGKPISNTGVYILGMANEIVPFGVIGELYISGDGLAEGYLNDPILSQNRFIMNPYKKDERIYKTGDLVKVLQDGNIVFIDRVDKQVKLRGFRIELGEVEEKLNQIPGIKTSVIIPIKNGEVVSSLAAYITVEKEMDSNQLRERLLECIPSYMIPSTIIQVEKFELNKNGKIDLSKLPKPYEIQKEEPVDSILDEKEQILAEVWKSILNVTNVNTGDNFFALGGDSIKAMQLSAYIKKYDLDIDIKTIFEYSVFKEMAAHIVKQDIVRDRIQTSAGEVELSPVQNWYFEHVKVDRHWFNQGIILNNKEKFCSNAVQRALDIVVKNHDSFSFRYETINDNIIQTYQPNEKKLFVYSILNNDNEIDGTNKLIDEIKKLQQSLSLEMGPLVGVLHVKDRIKESLIIVIHHLVIDAVSWRIFLDDFIQVYQQIEKGTEIKIIPESETYQSFVKQLKEYVKTIDFSYQKKYWLNKLHNYSDNTFKYWKVEGEEVEVRDSVLVGRVSDKIIKKLYESNIKDNVTLNTVILTAISKAIFNITGDNSILLNLEGHGRQVDGINLDLSRTIGWFTSIYPFEITNMSLPIDKLLDQIINEIEQVPSSGVGYGLMKYYCKDEILSNNVNIVEPTICFNYLGYFDEYNLNNISLEDCSLYRNSPIQERLYTLDINCAMLKEELKIVFDYDNHIISKHIIESINIEFQKQLEILVNLVHEKRKKDLFLPYHMTEIQTAYLIGRQSTFEIGNISTHNYMEIETLLEVDKMEQAVNMLIQRHEMLRTVFLPDATQKTLENVPYYKIRYEDISQLNNEEQKNRIMMQRNIMSHSIFEVEQWPSFEMVVFRLDDNKKLLFFSYDLLAVDSASGGILVKEFIELYRGEQNLKQINYTFKQYVQDCNDLKNTEVYKNCKKYWSEKLETFPSAPTLPFKCQPQDIEKPVFKRLKMTIVNTKWQYFVEKVSNLGLTSSSVLASIYGSILARYGNQQELAINMTVFNRYPFHPDIYAVVGDFTSVILLHYKDEPKTFWDKCKQLQITMAEGLENRHYNGVDFIRDYVNYHNIDSGKAVMPYVFTSMLFGDELRHRDEIGVITNGIGQTPQVFIDLQVLEVKGKLEVSWDYVEALFEESLMVEMFERYIEIINCICENDDVEQAVHMINDKYESKLDAIIEQYNSSEESITYKLLYDDFVKRAKENPEKIAVMDNCSEMTYKQLEDLSSKIAQKLIDDKLSVGESVGVYAERRVETIAMVLGILRAGGNYVPLNIDNPPERNKYILNSCNAKLAINLSWLEQNIEENSRVLENEIYVPIEEKAYIIFTSGSTGTPKGVVISHKACSNTIQDINQKFNVSNQDVFLAVSSLCFDLSVYDIFGALSVGAQLVIPADQRDIDNLCNLILDKKVTIWNSVPAILDLILKNNESIRYKSFRYILLSGDWIPLDIWGRMKKQCPDAKLISLGGATEASIWSIYYPVTSISENWRSIPYGYPLANQKMYVLDYNLKPCPINVTGDIYIGGIGLANEYIADEEKTNNAFVYTNDFGRIYKTGDYGVLKPEGYIEFLGRDDNQVKVRGYRIELGEIEEIMNRYEGITHSIAIINKEKESVSILGYVVSQKAVDEKELRAFISKFLPNYMIPNAIIQLEEVPLTHNGKIDKKLLPKIEKTNNSLYKAASNDIEDALVKAWSQVLNKDNIGIDDNFFEMGGTSLQAIQVVGILSKKFTISINDLFSNTTISKLAKVINYKKESVFDDIIRLKELLKAIENHQRSEAFECEFTKYNEKLLNENIIMREEFPKSILLTGGNGFFACHLIEQILLYSKAHITVLVRGKDRTTAEERFKLALEYYFPGKKYFEIYYSRIEVIEGNISQEKLGLNEEDYVRLSTSIEGIVHSAAIIQHYGLKEQFQKINVDGTKNVISFAKNIHLKEIHFTSTISAAYTNERANKNVPFSEFDLTTNETSQNYYIQSKVDSEGLIYKAKEEGLKVYIYRLGTLVNNSENGVFQMNGGDSALLQVFKVFLKLMNIPQMDSKPFDFTYINQAARAVYNLMNIHTSHNVFHIYNPNKFGLSTFAKLANKCGKDINLIPLDDYVDFIGQNANNISQELSHIMTLTHVNENVDQTLSLNLVCDRTVNILKGMDFKWEVVNEESMQKILAILENMK